MAKKNTHSGARLLIPFIIIFLSATVILGGTGFFLFRQFDRIWLENNERYEAALQDIRDLRINFTYEHNAITYGLSRGVRSSREIYKEAESKASRLLDSLEKKIRERSLLIDLRGLKSDQVWFSEQINKLFDYIYAKKSLSLTYDEQTDLKSYAVSTLREASKHSENFNTKLNSLEDKIAEKLQSRFREMRKSLLMFLIILTSAATSAFLLISLLSWLATKRVHKPVNSITKLVQDMEKNCYLKPADYGKIQDPELQYILKSFNNVITEFKNTLNQSSSSLEKILSVNEQLGTHLSELNLTENAIRNSQQFAADSLLEHVQEFDNVRFYFDSITRSIEEIQSVESEVGMNKNDIERRLSSLDINNGQINDALYHFSETAEKINLLALNINIEAAKLGEENRGFGIIATEIRKHISESLDNTKEFQRVLNDNKNLTRQTRDSFNTIKDYFAGLNTHFEDISAGKDKLAGIFTTERSLEKEIDLNTRKIIEARIRASEIIDELSGIQERNIRELKIILKEYRNRLKETAQSAVKPAESTNMDIAEQAVFGETENKNHTEG